MSGIPETARMDGRVGRRWLWRVLCARRLEKSRAVELCIAVDRYIDRYAEADRAVRSALWVDMAAKADAYRDGRSTMEMRR